MAALRENAITLLSSTASVDMNTSTPTSLFTVPATKNCIVTHVVIRNASTSLTTVSISFGFVEAQYDDVIADSTYTELTSDSYYTVIPAMDGAYVGEGTAGDIFTVLCNTLQGGVATVDIDVLGYLF